MSFSSRVLCAILAITGAGAMRPADAKKATALVITSQEIPKGFESYTLFLICNPEWLEANKKADLEHLVFRFRNFGDAIGDSNAAVWFQKPSLPGQKPEVDVPRSARFCKAWHLKPSEGPFIVITTSYPDEKRLSDHLPTNNSVLALGSATDGDIDKLLLRITDSLLATDAPPKNLNPAQGAVPSTSQTTQPQSIWTHFEIAIIRAIGEGLGDAGCALTVKINSGVVKSELHYCHKT